MTLLASSPGSVGARVSKRAAKPTALDRYVAAPDSNYAYRVVETIRREGFTTYVIRLTSQQWRTPEEVDHHIWEHWLTIVQPDVVSNPTGFLFISGGSISSKAPGVPVPIFTDMAVRTRSVVAELRTIPNEPLRFADEKFKRNEDAIIAYTWEKFMKTGDETWPLRLPMTKAAVRALDTITAFAGSTENGKPAVKVDRFIVSGGSKRGWTTWTTAAVDDRVVAIVPYVIDCLNLPASMDHHYRAYGFWAPAVGDYLSIWPWVGTPQYKALMKIEDPYEYRDRLTMPKLIVNSTGDQFFLPDSSKFYFDDLEGEKHLRYVPNTRHDLNNSDAPLTL
ncbi:MAG: PhoPQ-activated pathogenicity, partial [Acidobacteria bacterium]|nr:PhoPQ-activated pathogenicity [Acidobacteriota bacterium]